MVNRTEVLTETLTRLNPSASTGVVAGRRLDDRGKPTSREESSKRWRKHGQPDLRGGRPISSSTLPKMLQQHRIAAVPHGFRSSFRDWAAEKTDDPRGALRRRWLTSSRTRWRPSTRGRTCSNADGCSWTIGRSTSPETAGDASGHETALATRAIVPLGSALSAPLLHQFHGPRNVSASVL